MSTQDELKMLANETLETMREDGMEGATMMALATAAAYYQYVFEKFGLARLEGVHMAIVQHAENQLGIWKTKQ